MSHDSQGTEPLDTSLAADYYLDNFNYVVDHVTARYQDLFPAELSQCLTAYRQLTSYAQRLLVRLCSRQGEWFESVKLNYAEIADIDAAIEELGQACLVSCVTNPPVEVLALKLTVKSLKQILKGAYAIAPKQMPSKKAELSLALQQLAAEQPEVKIGEFIGSPWLKVNIQCHYDALLLLFFGNRYQDLTQFVVAELGLQQFYPYQLDRNSRLFNDWRSVEQLALLSDAIEQFELQRRQLDYIGVKKFEGDIPTNTCSDFLQYYRSKLQFSIGRDLERKGYLDDALFLYDQLSHSAAIERKTRVLIAQEHYQAALTLINDVLDSGKLYAEEQLIFLRLLNRCQRKLGIEVTGTRFKQNHDAIKIIQLTIGQLPLQQMNELGVKGVEEHVIYTYQQRGYLAFHLENSLFCSLFGLLFWDIIFAPIPGAFQHPFQSAPSDMYQPSFTDTRRAAIDQRLKEIALTTTADIYQRIEQAYEQYFGYVNDWVDWSRVTLVHLQRLLDSVSDEFIALLLTYMLQSLKHHRSGLPDLFVYHPNGSGFELIEVKGPTDKLQDNQKVWLDWLVGHGIDVAVCHVKYE
ncbi:VRR-NUC domain-containing protein [Shewanella waksmanii]|uniref:VRR-NUC domain-containing protein n=1 Tax=Shewanella waksmanii TaxID=213783 RepID=UPI000491FE33|nr:VRR-NUC domain-containing protein [Shewanella waksmanii]